MYIHIHGGTGPSGAAACCRQDVVEQGHARGTPVYVCVRERERGRERVKEGERERGREND